MFNRLNYYFLSKVDGFAASSSVLEGIFSKTYPSFLTLKEGSTFLTKPLFPQERGSNRPTRYSEPLRSKVGGQLLFSGVNIAIPYALMGIFVLSVALVLSRIKLPAPRRAHEADTNEKVEEKPMRVMAFGFGMLTLFLYVAAQTGVNSFFINYAEESIHIEKQTASLYLAFGGMGLFFIGRLAGGVIMNYIQPRLVLLVCAILTFVATLIVVVCNGTLSLIAFFALYLGESIMFPTIFSLALRDAGTKTKLTSSLLIMTIVGGAVAPVIMGYIADTTGSMAIAFLIPLVCYGVIGGYAAMPGCSSTDVKRG